MSMVFIKVEDNRMIKIEVGNKKSIMNLWADYV